MRQSRQESCSKESFLPRIGGATTSVAVDACKPPCGNGHSSIGLPLGRKFASLAKGRAAFTAPPFMATTI